MSNDKIVISFIRFLSRFLAVSISSNSFRLLTSRCSFDSFGEMVLELVIIVYCISPEIFGRGIFRREATAFLHVVCSSDHIVGS